MPCNIDIAPVNARKMADGAAIVTGYSKKVYHDLDHAEKCGFLHSVQRVSNDIFEKFLDIANL